MERLGYDFFHRECLEVARDLVGKILVVQNGKRNLERMVGIFLM